MATTPSRGRAPAAKTAIPQLPWDQVRPAPIVLVSGTETVLADRAIRLLRDILRAEDPSLEVSDIDAGAYAPGELLTLASPSLFAEPRLIRVENVDKMTDAFLDETLAYVAAPADETYLVLRYPSGTRGKKLLDAIRAGTGGGIEVVCAELKRDSDKQDFVAAEFAAARR
jgi:DNA polymerase-3 subunit delta